jgi:3-methyladenine DNA glycosylase AlkC
LISPLNRLKVLCYSPECLKPDLPISSKTYRKKLVRSIDNELSSKWKKYLKEGLNNYWNLIKEHQNHESSFYENVFYRNHNI